MNIATGVYLYMLEFDIDKGAQVITCCQKAAILWILQLLDMIYSRWGSASKYWLPESSIYSQTRMI